MLKFDRTAIADVSVLHADADQLAITGGLEWELMGIGIPEITAQNWPEIFRRISFQSRVYGDSTLRNDDGSSYFFTADDIKRRIGLKTNASKKSEAEWLEHIYENYNVNEDCAK